MKVERFAVVTALVMAGLLVLAPCINGTDLKKVTKLGAECTAGNKKSCQKLIRIATEWSESKEVRLAAVENLTDQSALREVAISVSEADICQAAVKRLTDERDLAAFARAANYTDTIAIAVAAVVEKVENQVLLADLAQNSKTSEVQGAAVLKVTDSARLKEIAMGTTGSTLSRVAAVTNPNLSDQELFSALVNTDKSPEVCAAAALRLTDPSLLSRIVENVADPQIRQAAVQNPRLDQSVRLRLAKSEKEWAARLAAFVGLDDQGLFEIANDANYADPPAPGDPNLFQTASYDLSGERPRPGHPGGRPIRIGGSPLRIEDDAGGLVLFTMGNNVQISCRSIEVRSLRELAALLIRDHSLLEKLAKNAADPSVRKTAEIRMKQLQR